MQPFLIDVYAIHPQGQDMHLGGGIFHATSANEAEDMAAYEHWSPDLATRGFDIGFMTDTPDAGQKVMSLAQLKASAPRIQYA